jgi:hypothetical protein
MTHMDGRPYIVGLFRDISMTLRAQELEKASEMAKASNQAKNIFLTTMRYVTFQCHDTIWLMLSIVMRYAHHCTE